MLATQKRVLLGACFWAVVLSPFACREDAPARVDRLAPILAHEQAQAVQAARIGPEGGRLEVTAGKLSGFSLEIPAGALGQDAVFSVYEAEAPDEKLGYRPLGPFVTVWATVDSLSADALITVPYADESEPDEKRIVLLARLGQMHPIGGAVLRGFAMRGLVRTFGDFGVASDLSIDVVVDDDSGANARCPRQLKWLTMRGAINASRLLAGLEMEGEVAPLSLTSYQADGCGYSAGWEVSWYNDAKAIKTYSTWATGTVFIGSSVLACTPGTIENSVDSTVLSDDFAIRWGQTAQGLTVRMLNCNTAPVSMPPKVRVTVTGSGTYAEYDLDGSFVDKNF